MLVRTGGLPALVFGQAVTGASNSLLLDQRRSVPATGVRDGAGDLDMTLSIMDGSQHGHADPAFAAHSDEAIWGHWLSLYVSSAIRLGWSIASATSVIDDGGNAIFFRL